MQQQAHLDFQPQHPPAVIKCCNNQAFMRSMNDGTFALVVTSPPYNIGKSYEKNAHLTTM